MKSYDYGILEWDRPHYTDPLRAETLRLAQPWLVAVRHVVYWVPGGEWDFDGASIPRLFWRLVGPPLRGTYRRGALLHDACYKGICRAYPFDPAQDIARIRRDLDEFPALVPECMAGRQPLPIEREEADDLLEILARWNGTPAWKAKTMRRGVRWFGGRAWRNEHAKHASFQYP